MTTSDHRQQRQEEGYPEKMQSKKCYRCERFGHTARESPEKAVKVNQTFQKKSPSEDTQTNIIALKVLAKAQDRGWDVDSLKVVPNSRLKPVFDASNNRMDFVGAVHIEVEMDSEKSEVIAFHISADKEADAIIGTDALEKVGIDVGTVNKLIDDEGDPRIYWRK
ncbi:zinc knuckle [Cooperia oncophora]